MNRVSAWPGMWLLMLVGVFLIVVAGVASAAPGYPVMEPVETRFTAAYDPTSRELSLSTSTTDEALTSKGPDSDVVRVDGDTSDVSVSVVGPNGQVNHGQIVKRVHELTDGHLLGCVTRTVAQSDLGKDDQQVRPKDVSTSSIGTEAVDPSLLEGECSDNSTSGNPQSTDTSNDSTAGQDQPHGKSPEAPGRSK